MSSTTKRRRQGKTERDLEKTQLHSSRSSDPLVGWLVRAAQYLLEQDREKVAPVAGTNSTDGAPTGQSSSGGT